MMGHVDTPGTMLSVWTCQGPRSVMWTRQDHTWGHVDTPVIMIGHLDTPVIMLRAVDMPAIMLRRVDTPVIMLRVCGHASDHARVDTPSDHAQGAWTRQGPPLGAAWTHDGLGGRARATSERRLCPRTPVPTCRRPRVLSMSSCSSWCLCPRATVPTRRGLVCPQCELLLISAPVFSSSASRVNPGRAPWLHRKSLTVDIARLFPVFPLTCFSDTFSMSSLWPGCQGASCTLFC